MNGKLIFQNLFHYNVTAHKYQSGHRTSTFTHFYIQNETKCFDKHLTRNIRCY